MAAAHVSPDDIGAVVAANSTITAMPSLARSLLAAAAGLSSRDRGHRAGRRRMQRRRRRDLARPRPCPGSRPAGAHRRGDYCSPWFHPEPDLRGDRLRGCILSSALFTDATAAAVDDCPAPARRLVSASSMPARSACRAPRTRSAGTARPAPLLPVRRAETGTRSAARHRRPARRTWDGCRQPGCMHPALRRQRDHQGHRQKASA